MNRKFPKKYNSQVAILGCGYIGIFTAKILAENGYQVKIYAKEFPHKKQETSTGYNLASEAAGGYWMPYGYDLDQSIKIKKRNTRFIS